MMSKINTQSNPGPGLQRIGLAFAVTLLMAGCASAPAPTAQMAVAKVEVNNAMSAGGNEYAPVQLKAAMDELNGAEKAMAAENYEQARTMAERAEVDAKLAAATARSAKAQKAAETVKADVQVLRNELDRKQQ
jgi:hypothetical protein